MSAYPLKNAKNAGVSVRIAHAHNKSQDKDLKYPIKLISKKMIPHYSTELFACGKEAGDWMFSGKPFQVMHNAIDVARYQYNEVIRKEVRQELHIEGRYVIGHVGRFRLQKNHDFLVDIFAAYHTKHPGSVLMLVGEGDELESIEEKVRKLNLQDDVIFTGGRMDVNRMMQAMDVFVFPSLYEGLPVTMIEAQAAGLPCIMSDRVPEECVLTDLVQINSLSDSPEKWSESIAQTRTAERKNQSECVLKAGYDIADNAKKLQEFYISESSKYE